jgi:hypothetical protein
LISQNYKERLSDMQQRYFWAEKLKSKSPIFQQGALFSFAPNSEQSPIFGAAKDSGYKE